jgi:hypothetical protein
LKPKPLHIIKLIWLVTFGLSLLILPENVLSQSRIDSLDIHPIAKDSLSNISLGIDTLNLVKGHISDIQIVKSEFGRKIDSVYAVDGQGIIEPNKITDTLTSGIKLGKVLPKKPGLNSKIDLNNINTSVENQNIDVPNTNINQLINLDKLENTPLAGHKGKFSSLKSKIEPSLKIKQEIDSFSLESIENKAGALAKNNITELQELDKMEGAANNARSQVKNLKWDKSKIKSSQNIAKVLSENVEAVQAGMDKMKDFKGKYSKVNLMNPNGPVLQEISKKPSKPWQFGLNFSSQFRNGLSLQLAPTVGYRLQEKWTGGVGISYQFKVFDQDSTFAFEPQQQFSHRIFNQINFYRNFFLHLEHELPYRQQYKNKEGPWHKLEAQKPKGWLGMALQYKLYKDIKGQTQILYNIIKPDGMDVSESRWAIRVNLIF